jgi:signal transduction histidine kinase
VASLRSRLLLGAMLWTIGLFVSAFVALTVIMFSHPGSPRIIHGSAYGHGFPLMVLSVVSMIGGFWLVRRGISPVNQLRSRLGAVRDGRARRLEGSYPSEVQPLVEDLNALLDHREQTVRRALAKAGDLAHGLKTPLAVLAHEADRAAAAGHSELADAIGQQVERMRRQTEYHLAQARAVASGATAGAQCSVVACTEGLIRTVQQLHADRGLSIEAHVPPAHVVRCQREDLDEMLGNLIDNACKWARGRVLVDSLARDDRIVIAVNDDGPGIEPSMRDRVLQRGVRADEAAPGTGLGLGIVRDLAELYTGSIVLDASPLGGLRARLELPGSTKS